MIPIPTYILIPISLIIGFLTAKFAAKKNRRQNIWFSLGFLFGVFAPLVLAFLPKIELEEEEPEAPVMAEPVSYIDWYYLDANHQQVGPLSFQALQKAYGENLITGKSYFWNETMDNWSTFENHPNIVDQLST